MFKEAGHALADPSALDDAFWEHLSSIPAFTFAMDDGQGPSDDFNRLHSRRNSASGYPHRQRHQQHQQHHPSSHPQTPNIPFGPFSGIPPNAPQPPNAPPAPTHESIREAMRVLQAALHHIPPQAAAAQGLPPFPSLSQLAQEHPSQHDGPGGLPSLQDLLSLPGGSPPPQHQQQPSLEQLLGAWPNPNPLPPQLPHSSHGHSHTPVDAQMSQFSFMSSPPTSFVVPSQSHHHQLSSLGGPSLSEASASASGSASTSAAVHDTPSPVNQEATPPTDPEVSVIEDKRRRNTAASARFRIKKKQKTLNLERTVNDLSGRVEELEHEASELRRENGWLKEIVMLKSRQRVEGLSLPEQPPGPPDEGDEGEDKDKGKEKEDRGEGSSTGKTR
ncbi:unnamed protein product [Peniophora sp. CBMAI 1063]|nr:unnamed protein product [Peniophora sp. CBMAI 1063]